jgi:hypothetical protein
MIFSIQPSRNLSLSLVTKAAHFDVLKIPEEQPVEQFSDLELIGSYYYFDCLSWQFEEIVELIKGKVYSLSALGTTLQTTGTNIGGLNFSELKGKSCRLSHAHTDVIIESADEVGKLLTLVIQPDLFVIYDTKK